MKKQFILIFSCIVSFTLFAQEQNIDSLLTLLKTDKEDTNKVKHLIKLCGGYYLIGEDDKGLPYGKQALTLSQKLDFNKGIGSSSNNMGLIYLNQGNYPEALKNFFISLTAREKIKDKKGIAYAYNNIGLIYFNQGNYPEALINHFASLKMREEIKIAHPEDGSNKQGIAASYNNIGLIYKEQGNYPEALKNYFASLKIEEEFKDKQGIASSYNNIGIIYFNQGKYPEALENYYTSLKIREEIKDKRGLAYCYQCIALIYMNQGNYREALHKHLAALKIEEEIGDKEGLATSLVNLGNLYTKLDKPKDANAYLNKALQLSAEIGSKDVIKEVYGGMAVLDSATGNFKAAFAHHKLYILYRDSLNNEESQRKSLQASLQYEFDKKEIAAKAEQEKRNAVNLEEKQKQQIAIYAVAGVLLLVIVFSLFLFNRFRITQKQKKIIENQKVLVDKAYEQLHEKNKEVMDSIYYARQIQRALLTSEKYIERNLNRLLKR
jgi:tetratricopeptide (TPR) repeat protein